MFKNKNFLVTGGGGFIGSHLVEYLINNDNNVVCIDDFSTGKHENLKFVKDSNFRLIKQDIISVNFKELSLKFSGVFHLAAQTSVPLSMEDFYNSSEITYWV